MPKKPASPEQLAANRQNAKRSTGPRTPEGKARSSRNARKHGFCSADFAIVRIEDIQHLDNLRADLVHVYRPVNSQELFALERMAFAQLGLLRAQRLEAGLFTEALAGCLADGDHPFHPLPVTLVSQEEVLRSQNRNYALGDGFRRIAQTGDTWRLFLRYQAQAERFYRRAVEEFERLKALRGEFPNEPISEVEPEPSTPVYPPPEPYPIPPPPDAAPPHAVPSHGSMPLPTLPPHRQDPLPTLQKRP